MKILNFKSRSKLKREETENHQFKNLNVKGYLKLCVKNIDAFTVIIGSSQDFVRIYETCQSIFEAKNLKIDIFLTFS